MTNKQPDAQFDWATELLDARGRVTLSAQEANEIGARLRSMGEKLNAYEDLDEAASDVQLLRTGYAAARLEIESLQSRIKTMSEEHADELTVVHLDGRMRGCSTEPAGEYPALPEPDRVMEDWSIGGVLVDYFTTDQMRAYADATCAMRAAQSAGAQQPAPSAAAVQTIPGVQWQCGPQANGFTAPQADSQPAAALDEREAFELWARPRGLQLRRNDALGHYGNIDTQRCWEGWQARAPADSVLEDAARWQMAALIGNEVMLHPDKRTNPAAVKAYMDAVHSGLDLTGAIDAARTNGDTP